MELDIRDINTYVLALKTENEERRKNIKQLFSDLKIKNWSFFDSMDVRGKLPYWIGCALSHREAIAQAKFPCIIYEDDVKPTDWYTPIIEDPGDRILYLGLSMWGMKSGKSTMNGAIFSPNSNKTSVVKYMCSTHSLYYPSKEVAEKFASDITRFILETSRPFDELYAQKQVEIETLCLNSPIFCQDDPKTFNETHFRLEFI